MFELHRGRLTSSVRMVRFEFELEIDSPVAEVWDELTDPGKAIEWQTSLVTAEKVADEPIGVGTRIHDERRFLGRRIDSLVEVTEYEPERVFTIKGLTGPVRFEIHQRLEPLAEGCTRVQVFAEADPHGVSRLAAPLIARTAEHELRRDFDHLKETLERR
jgi:carbon monoxide dehydrogenase subunit G